MTSIMIPGCRNFGMVAVVCVVKFKSDTFKNFSFLIYANPRLTLLPTHGGVLRADLTHCPLPYCCGLPGLCSGRGHHITLATHPGLNSRTPVIVEWRVEGYL